MKRRGATPYMKDGASAGERGLRVLEAIDDDTGCSNKWSQYS